METTTGTTLVQYVAWLKREAEAKQFGEVGIYLTIHEGQIVDVRRTSVDTEHYSLSKQNGQRVAGKPARR